MKITDFLPRFGRSTADTPKAAPRADGGVVINTPEELAEYINHGVETFSGQNASPAKAATLSSVYRAVDILSSIVSTVPVDLMKSDGETSTRLPKHPLVRILRRRPNSYMKRGQFFYMMHWHMLLRGYAVAMKVRDRKGKISELIPLHPDRVEVIQRRDLSLVFKYTPLQGQPVTLPHREVLYLARNLSGNGYKGLSPLFFAREAIGTGLGVERHAAAMWKNGTLVGSVIKSEKELGEDAIKRLQDSLDRFRSAENHHKSIVLEDGLEFESVGLSAVDSQMIESRAFSRADIAMFFGVPAHTLGDTSASDGSGKNLEERTRSFMLFTLEAHLTTWEDAIEADLIDEEGDDPDVEALFRRSNITRADIATRTKYYQSALQWGWMNPDEVRGEEGKGPRADGKGGEYYPPPNMTKDANTEDEKREAIEEREDEPEE